LTAASGCPRYGHLFPSPYDDRKAMQARLVG